jgi:ankyrin repeat protein
MQFLSAGANLSAKDVRGWTALHWAAINGNDSVVSTLCSVRFLDFRSIYVVGWYVRNLERNYGHQG